MQQFFSSGTAADVVLAVLALEALLLWRRGWTLRRTAGLLLPAALIVLALRAALVEAHWAMIAVPLALAFPAHLLDLAQRSRNG
ncbi:MAG: hypothetical protein ACO25F_01640 [Erythrobacter sp.]